jgi:hypothetical protein
MFETAKEFFEIVQYQRKVLAPARRPELQRMQVRVLNFDCVLSNKIGLQSMGTPR